MPHLDRHLTGGRTFIASRPGLIEGIPHRFMATAITQERLEAARLQREAPAAPLQLLGRAPWIGATLARPLALETLRDAVRSGQQGR